MQLNEIIISEDSHNKLSTLNGRTGLLLYDLIRIGLYFSLDEANEPEIDVDSTDGSELNRITLMGEWDPLIIYLLRERHATNGHSNDNEDFVRYFRAHLNRGILLVYGRSKDIENLVKSSKPEN